jgi:hypothetical protein
VIPGQTVEYREVSRYDETFSSGTCFVVFCNELGHDERG